MITLHKFELPPSKHDEEILLSMSPDARPLYVGMQNSKLMVWCLLDDQETRKVLHRFVVGGTGHNFNKILEWTDARHLGTLQLKVGGQIIGSSPTEIVVHVFYGGYPNEAE